MRTHLQLTLVALFWGGTFVAGRVVVQEMTPLQAASGRFALAAIVLLAVVRAREGRIPRLAPRQWLGVTALGATGVFAYNLFFFSGLQYVPAGRAALIVALNPVLIALLASRLLGEPLPPSKLLGVATAFAGVALVVSDGDPRTLLHGALGPGEALIFGCVASWVSYTLIGGRVLRELSPLVATAFACLTGGLLLAAANGVAGGYGGWPDYSLRAWGGLLFLGLLGTAVAFTWFYQGVRTLGAARAGIFINLVPVFGVMLGVALLGEPVDAGFALGAALVIGGVVLVNRPTRAARE